MFCLRSWVPIFFLLLRTNVSPVYLVLFISATYFLNRPCIYCSFLLAVLVIALLDFHAPWFENALPTTEPLTARDTLIETASIMTSAANNTAQALIKAAADGLKAKTTGSPGSGTGQSYEWMKGLLGKKEWRVPCLDVLIRI
ncbi:hypothetical protein BDV96DRAFT_568287 [Lophiotrema nucula]|uniref:Uncharacterized protein n=1 Tax=Lophiotrema nucula TaxID=690887 RepID=A0A6A5ZHG0_9PLEO|nr:hypothetical protein BDV96DRAFT_568287 [Lophiotrema nucula]